MQKKSHFTETCCCVSVLAHNGTFQATTPMGHIFGANPTTSGTKLLGDLFSLQPPFAPWDSKNEQCRKDSISFLSAVKNLEIWALKSNALFLLEENRFYNKQ
jgi:hypothetical protein